MLKLTLTYVSILLNTKYCNKIACVLIKMIYMCYKHTILYYKIIEKIDATFIGLCPRHTLQTKQIETLRLERV